MNYNPLNNAMSYLKGMYNGRISILHNSGLELAIANDISTPLEKDHANKGPSGLLKGIAGYAARIGLPFALAGYLLASSACGGQATSPSLPPTNPNVQVVEESQADYPLAEWIPADPSNYRPANRKRGDINQIVIHTTEAASLESTISWFQNPESNVSAHYLIDPKGRIIQMVREKDIAWHAREYNDFSIGIEHVGKTNDPNWATEEMYQASAKLVRYLADKHGIPIDRSHIRGHDELHNKSDPGKFWKWDLYMSRVKLETTAPTVSPTSAVAQDNETILVKTVRFLKDPYRFDPNPIVVENGKTYTFHLVEADEPYAFSSLDLPVDTHVYPAGHPYYTGKPTEISIKIDFLPGEYPIFSYMKQHEYLGPLGKIIVKPRK